MEKQPKFRFGEGVILLIALILVTAGCFIASAAKQPEPERFEPRHETTVELPKLDLNAATAEELAELPGIGPSMAENILEWRASHGAFTSVDQLLEVEGIGEKKLADIREFICVKG